VDGEFGGGGRYDIFPYAKKRKQKKKKSERGGGVGKKKVGKRNFKRGVKANEG